MRRWIPRLLWALVAVGGLLPLRAPAAIESPSDPLLESKLDLYLTRYAAFGFSGAVLVKRHGQVILEKGYGYANDRSARPYTRDTVFDIGSITKVFTAAAILKLQMQGKLRIEDPIAKYLPGVPADKRDIRLTQLLSHSSGIQTWGEEDYEPVGPDEYVRRALAAPLAFAPGTKTAYSNAGFSLLGAIIERVSGECWERYLDENVFGPAGMTRTGYRASKWRPDQIANGYPTGGEFGSPLDHPGPYRPRSANCSPGPYWNLATNGGALSTLEDLSRFDTALYSKTVFSDEALSAFSTPHTSDPEWGDNTQFTYGWDITKTKRGTRIVHKTGSSDTEGIGAWLMRYVDEQSTIVVTTNRMVDDMIPSRFIGARLDELISGEDPPLPPAAAEGAASLEELRGVYRLPTGETLAVTTDGGALRIEGRGRAATSMLAFGNQPIPPADVQQSVAILLQALDRGDTESLRGMLWKETWFDIEMPYLLRYWKRTIEDWGPFRGAEVIAAVPGVFVQNLFVRSRFAGGTQVLVLQRNDVGRFRIPGQRSRLGVPASLRFLPQGGDAFASFSLVAGPGARIRFTRDHDGRPERLIVSSQTGEVIATHD